MSLNRHPSHVSLKYNQPRRQQVRETVRQGIEDDILRAVGLTGPGNKRAREKFLQSLHDGTLNNVPIQYELGWLACLV